MKGDFVKEGQKLPMYGKGPFYVFSVFVSSVIFFILHISRIITVGNLTGVLRIAFMIVGIVIAIEGGILWIMSTNHAGMREHIANNELNQSGVYAWVRNPMYAGMMFFGSGLLISCGNLLYLVLPCVYYIILTVMLKNTEEKWLTEIYGEEYAGYCRWVNRCIPWPPKKRRI